MSLPDPYIVKPWRVPCQGSVTLPGSKSITNRALILAALSPQTIRIKGALFSRDSKLLTSNLRSLGFSVRESEQTSEVEISGASGRIPNARAELFVGNAGTVARFLTALVCLHPGGHYHFDGDEEMRKRPMGGLISALQNLGAAFSFHAEKDCFPFEVRTRGLRGGDWQVDASASSQMLSALMMVAPMASGDVNIQAAGARPSFVRMTASMMQQFGVRLKGSAGEGFSIPSGQLYEQEGAVYLVEPDATAASYFTALPFVTGGSLQIEGMRFDLLQGDVAFARVLCDLGLRITEDRSGWMVKAPESLTAPSGPLCFETFSDTFLTLAAIAPLFPWPVHINNIGHTRHQETDRIAAAAAELARAGVKVEEGPAALSIQPFSGSPPKPGAPVVIQTYRDHRMAMSFTLLGSSRRFGPDPWLAVADPSCCGKTFPEFFAKLDNLYRISHDK